VIIPSPRLTAGCYQSVRHTSQSSALIAIHVDLHSHLPCPLPILCRHDCRSHLWVILGPSWEHRGSISAHISAAIDVAVRVVCVCVPPFGTRNDQVNCQNGVRCIISTSKRRAASPRVANMRTRAVNGGSTHSPTEA